MEDERWKNRITDSWRHGSPGIGCLCCQACRCRAPTHGSGVGSSSNHRHATNGTNQSLVLWGLSRFLMNKSHHTNPDTTPKHCRGCHKDQVRLEVCRQLVECPKWSGFLGSTTQLRSLRHTAQSSSLLDMRIPIMLLLASANLLHY